MRLAQALHSNRVIMKEETMGHKVSVLANMLATCQHNNDAHACISRTDLMLSQSAGEALEWSQNRHHLMRWPRPEKLP